MAWDAYFFQVTTGRIGPRADIASVKWNISINKVETLSIDLEKSSLPPKSNVDLWLEPWWSGILLTWNKIPIFAGPITGIPKQTFTTLSFDCSGIRSILARRYVIDDLSSDWSLVPKWNKTFTSMPRWLIARFMVQLVLQRPSGALPIAFPSTSDGNPSWPSDDADHTRTVKGFDISNIDCDAMLTKLSESISGPDIMFKPRLASDSQLMWDMWNGSEVNPYIPQTNLYILDTTAVNSDISDMTITSSAGTKTNRVYGTGAGSDEGTVIQVVQNLSNLSKGYPFLESVVTSSLETPKAVTALAQSELNANLDTLKEITLSVRIDGMYPLGTYSVGDAMKLYIKGWYDFDDGFHDVRLLEMSGSLDTIVNLTFQKIQG